MLVNRTPSAHAGAAEHTSPTIPPIKAWTPYPAGDCFSTYHTTDQGLDTLSSRGLFLYLPYHRSRPGHPIQQGIVSLPTIPPIKAWTPYPAGDCFSTYHTTNQGLDTLSSRGLFLYLPYHRSRPGHPIQQGIVSLPTIPPIKAWTPYPAGDCFSTYHTTDQGLDTLYSRALFLWHQS